MVTDMPEMFNNAKNFNQPIHFETDIDFYSGLLGTFENTTNLESPIYITVKKGCDLYLVKNVIFKGSKIMEHSEYIKITENKEIKYLNNKTNLLYAMSKADEKE